MNIRTLRTVLLIQSIEESDRAGHVLPVADRAEATRTAARETPPRQAGQPELAQQAGQLPQSGAAFSRSADTFLARRAELLLARVRMRSPAVDHVLAVAGGLTWLGRAVLVVALIVGLSLSALDGSRRINILSFPLIGLIAWNLFIYALLIVARLKHRRAAPRGGFWSGHFYERWIGGRIDSLLKQSTRFNAPLATALRRFTSEWTAVEHPLLLERATRLMHLAAALVAAGLIAGLYIRGVALRYEAGWESTFLGPTAVHTLLMLFYGPAAALSGIGLPSIDDLNALRWTGVAGGGEAASWIHLIALTAVLYIVVPRMILACVSGFKLWRLSRNPPLPAALFGYARTLLGGAAGGVVRENASVTTFAYEPSPTSVAGLQTLLAATLGAVVKVEMRAAVRYGDEELFKERLAQKSGHSSASASASASSSAAGAGADAGARAYAGAGDWSVLLMTVASTPEAENHGAIISAMRDRLAQASTAAPLLVVVDSGPFAERMRGDTSFEQRLKERIDLWSKFVAAYGLRACIVDLSQIMAGAPSEIEAREAARAALWSTSDRLPAP